MSTVASSAADGTSTGKPGGGTENPTETRSAATSEGTANDEGRPSPTMIAMDVSYWFLEGCFRKEKKVILHNVTCLYKKGVNIILGPSGSGKSTFLDILADRKNPMQTSGQVLVNGKPRALDFKTMVGYVTQDDYLMTTLTVRENIAFSAALRLPSSLGAARKRSRVADIIGELGLEKCADTKIGDDLVRGVSGGERKRCNIGMELVTSPCVLFLDEPTTGLDASTAHSVMTRLKALSRTGRVIILSIHQPRYSIYQMADTTTMLCSGRLLYYGPPKQVLQFLSSQGFDCDPFNNPADFILDTITAESHSESRDVERATSGVEKLIEAYKTSKWQTSMDAEIEEIIRDGAESPAPVLTTTAWMMSGGVHYANNWFRQVVIISRRGLIDVVKNPQITLAMIVKSVVLSLFVGSLFFQLADDEPRATQDRTGVLFFLVLIQQFINIAAVGVFISERKLFVHEKSNGYYRTSAYFVSKVFNDLIPLRLIPVVILATSMYFAVGLRQGLDHFLVLVCTLYSICVTAASLSFMVGCMVAKEATGGIVMSMIVALSNLYAGFLINFDSMPRALAWIQYLSIAKYGFRLVMVNEFQDRVFHLKNSNRTIYGNEYLEQLDLDKGNTLKDFLPSFIALASISGGALLVAYLLLRCRKEQS